MSTRNLLIATAALAFACSISAAVAETPGLGKPVTEAELALWDISIGPNGVGLPAGSGTAAQGAAIFAQKCEVCHGKGGYGGPNSALTSAPGRTDRTM